MRTDTHHPVVMGCIWRPVSQLEELPVQVDQENAARWSEKAEDDQEASPNFCCRIVKQSSLLQYARENLYKHSAERGKSMCIHQDARKLSQVKVNTAD